MDFLTTPIFLFFRDFTSINMVLFFVTLVNFARTHFFVVALFWRAMFLRRLIVATKVAFVLIMCVMVAFPVVIVATAVARLAFFRIVVALLIGALGLVAMDMARLTRKLRRSFSLDLSRL